MKAKLMVFTGLLSLLMFASFPVQGAEDLHKIIIGHSSMRNDIAALWVPKELEIFRKYGLDMTILLISGGQRMTQAIVSGSVPIGTNGGPTVASAVAAGSDIAIILGMTNRLTYDIWAKPEIRNPEDLRGKTLGISSFGSSSHIASFLMLKHFTLDEKRDQIVILAMGDEPTRAQALIAGRIDATIVDPSVSSPLKERGFTYLGNLQELGVPFVGNSFVSTRRYVNEQPRVVEAVIKSIVEGNAYILNPANRVRVTEVLAKNLRLKTKEAETAYEDLLPKVEQRPYPIMEGLKATIQIMGLRNPKIAQLKPEDLVDLSILQKLDQSGFIDRLKR